jgi:F1F0 ATPase subunit 2
MNEARTWMLASLAGGALGAIFFGGLWWTARKGVSSPRPALWFLASGLLRVGIVLAGFYFVSGGQWKRLLPCLLGFTIARLAVPWLARPAAESLDRPKPGARHAP